MSSQLEEASLLRDARGKAQRLVAALVAQSQDLEQFAGRIAPQTLEQGRRALQQAMESARRTLDGIEQALRDIGQFEPEGEPHATE